MRRVQFFPNDGKPLRAEKVDRNAPCPCGSGKKAKVCCGTEVKYYHRVRKPEENARDAQAIAEGKDVGSDKID